MKVEAIILAAGYSSRADAFKPLLDLNGKSLIERCMECMYDICTKVIVVGGYKIEKIAEVIKKYPKAQVVFNHQYDAGMFTSVKEGIRHISGDRIFIIPGDYPMISEQTCRKMLENTGNIIIPKWCGKMGHPVLMQRTIADEILLEPDSSNLRDFINKKGYTTVDIDEKGILEDIDTQQDYKRIMKMME